MKQISLFLFLLFAAPAFSQDTFSIVAVDSVTGEIGSAGASCVPIVLPNYPHGVQIIGDVVAGVGAVNTQAQFNSANQANAHNRLVAGDSAQSIIDWLISNDAQNDSSIRQYGVVVFNNGHPLSSGFTGAGCMNYKNHVTGPGYSIQGNILLGQQILDSMEAHFLNTSGTLSDRLMAALQGAKVVGADTRCAPYGLSSLSSFIRVAGQGNTPGNYSLDLFMAYSGGGSGQTDPIDSLQHLYDSWLVGVLENQADTRITVSISKRNNEIVFELSEMLSTGRVELFDSTGKKLFQSAFKSKKFSIPENNLNNKTKIFLYRISSGNTIISSGRIPY
jgi:uncharacterized Ntn-hydrolase superfamily protein